MSCSPERISSYRRHFHGSTSSLVKVRVSSPSPVRTSARSASYGTAAAKAMPAAGRMSRTASSSSNRRLPIVAVSSGAFGGFGNGACPPTADLDAAAAENREFLSTRSGERQEMIVLNDRLAAYIEKVRSLETRNTLLESEIEALQNRFVKPTGMRRLYEDQLKELLRIANQARVQRDLAVVAKEAMAGQLEEIRRRYEEALEQRKQAEMDLVALRPDVDRATSTRIAMEKQLEQLEAEIEFLKRIQKEEIEELMQQIYATVATAQSSFALPDLSAALKQIQTQYEDIAAKNLQEMDSWYGSKFEDMGNKSSKNIDKLRSAREEMNNMKKEIQNKAQDLEDLQAKNDGSEAQLRETQERHKAELENLKARIEALQTELKTTKQKTAKLLHEYQELLNVKMALEVEIITYRKLIEGEDSRLTVMQLSLGSSGSMGASSVGKSTVTLGGGGSVVAKNGDGINGGGSVAAMNGDGINGGGSVAAKNGDGSVKAKIGGPGTGSAESGSNANNGDGQEGKGVGANGSGQNGENGQNGQSGPNDADAVTEASASAAGKGIGEEVDAKVVGGASGPGRSSQRSANGGTTPDESDTAPYSAAAVEKCCHCHGVRRRGSAQENAGGEVEGEAMEVMERKTVLIRTVRMDHQDVLESDVMEKTFTVNGANGGV